MQAEASLEGVRRRLEGFVDSLDMEQSAHEAAQRRLKAVRQLLAECDCATVAELLEAAEGAQAALEQWNELAGAPWLRWRIVFGSGSERHLQRDRCCVTLLTYMPAGALLSLRAVAFGEDSMLSSGMQAQSHYHMGHGFAVLQSSCRSCGSSATRCRRSWRTWRCA